MNVAGLLALLLETLKVSQYMDASSDQGIQPIWNNGLLANVLCSPDGKTSTGGKIGFCSVTGQLVTKCSRLDISHSNDCLQFEGNWCCYPGSNSFANTLSTISTLTNSATDPLLLQHNNVTSTSTAGITNATTPTSTTVTTSAPSTTTITTSASSSTASSKIITNNLSAINDNLDTSWKWSNGQSALSVASNSVVNVLEQPAVSNNPGPGQFVYNQYVMPDYDDGYRRKRYLIYPPASNRCWMWTLFGGWNANC